MLVERVGIIGGAGWLGSAIAESLVSSGAVDPARLICSYRSAKPAKPTAWQWTQDNAELAAASDIIVISVQPADWPSVSIKAGDKLVVSVMAGVRIANLQERTGSTRLARALPNAAAEVRASYTPIFMMSDLPDDRTTVCSLFEACGSVDLVTAEDHIDYFTAMSGSGAAFPALLAEAMMADATDRGIPADIAQHASLQTLIGAGRIFEKHNVSPADTVKAFVDYKGTTAAGIQKMRELGFESAVQGGLKAAYLKAKALSRA